MLLTIQGALNSKLNDENKINWLENYMGSINLLTTAQNFELESNWKSIQKPSQAVFCGENSGDVEQTSTLQRKSDLCTARKETARPQSQFPHSCICERFIYSHDQSTYFLAAADR